MFKFATKLIKGRTLSRHKRFTVKVQLQDKQIVETYCPNTGPMTGVWQENRFCWIQPRSGAGKLPYILRLIETDTALVGVDTHLPNIIINQALTDRAPTWFIDTLPQFDSFKAEVSLGPSWRVDFLLKSHDKVVPLEVKNVLWKPCNSLAVFPDTVTTRGQKHIQRLTQFAQKHNTNSIILYVIQRSDCTKFTISQNQDLKYWQLWQNNTYVTSLAVTCQIEPTHIALHQAVSIIDTVKI